jgi:hypothetical protein
VLLYPVGGVFQAVVSVQTQLKMHTIPQRSVTSPDINWSSVSGVSGSLGKFELQMHDNSLS